MRKIYSKLKKSWNYLVHLTQKNKNLNIQNRKLEIEKLLYFKFKNEDEIWQEMA